MKRTLLLLEDDAVLHRQLSRFLARRGFDVSSAATVAEFEAALRRARFDAVLFDRTLPDGDGVDAWATLHHLQPAAIAVLMSAYAGPAVTERALATGVRAVLPKPLHLNELLHLFGATATEPTAAAA